MTRRAPSPGMMAFGLFVVLLRVFGLQDALAGWKLETSSNAIVLTAVEQSDRLTYFSLRNASNKAIAAFAYSFGDDTSGTGMNQCFDVESPCIPPGTIYKLLADLRRETSTLRNRTVHIVAIVFEDGTGEGSSFQIDNADYMRLGLVLECERVKELLASIGERPVDDESIAELADGVGKLPLSPEMALDSVRRVNLSGVRSTDIEAVRNGSKGARLGFLQGVSSEREQALRNLEQLRGLPISADKNGGSARLTFLTLLQQRYERSSASHRAYYQRTRGGLHR